jgi:hypothetical protein
MPTGYTAAITKDMPLETFVWVCARAFGALITMRDDPQDAPIPQKLEPSTYHRDALVEARHRLRIVQAWTTEQAAEDQCIALKNEREASLRYARERVEKRAAYERMLALVDTWQPPTSEHVELKKFMREQIEGSIDFDCRGATWIGREEVSPELWKSNQIAGATESIERHTREWEAEMRRTSDRNEWIAAIRQSFDSAVVR